MGTVGVELDILDLQAQLCQALADPKRLRILYHLAEREYAVGELAQDLDVPIANVSQHLNVLKGRGLVRSRREGNSILYGLAQPEIMDACRVLRTVLSHQLAQSSLLSQQIEKNEMRN